MIFLTLFGLTKIGLLGMIILLFFSRLHCANPGFASLKTTFWVFSDVWAAEMLQLDCFGSDFLWCILI